MKRLIFGFLLGVVAGVLGYWYFDQNVRQADLNAARDAMLQGAGRVKDAISEKIGEIRPEDVKQELARTGTVIREKARQAGGAIADAASDTRITASIKAKYLKESGLSSMKIHVETSDGLVTLSGVAASHEQVARAINFAMETEGVHKVVSTIQVRPGA
jgi:hypothetical protein